VAVKKHKDGKRWVADLYYREAGKLKRKEKITLTKQAGVDWIAQTRRELREPKKKRRESRTIAETVAWFRTRSKYRHSELSTQKTYDHRLRVFLTWCNEQGLKTLKHFFDPEVEEDRYLHPESYYQFLIDRYKPITVETHLQVVKTLANEEIRRPDHFWTSSPWAGIEKKKKEQKEIRWFDRQELKALRSSMSELELHLFDLLLHTGMRTSELRYLTWDQVFDDHIKILPHDGWKPKHGRRRNIPLNTRAKECTDYFRGLGQKKYVVVVPGKSGIEPSSHKFVYRRFTAARDRARKATGLSFSGSVVHTFRATCGSFILQQGVPIAFVSSFLGHADIRTTQMHYASLAQENLEFAATSLNGLLEG
jgi:integrase